MQVNQIVLELAEALSSLDPSVSRQVTSKVDRSALEKARDFLDENIEQTVRSKQLEAISGLDRYRLARQFRAAYGTSPYRYLVMRRLDRARRLIQAGRPLCDAALASGFTDQSHMTRHFKKAYGLSPGRWAAITADTAGRQVAA